MCSSWSGVTTEIAHPRSKVSVAIESVLDKQHQNLDNPAVLGLKMESECRAASRQLPFVQPAVKIKSLCLQYEYTETVKWNNSELTSC